MPSLDDFASTSGWVPVFPLPNLVPFPVVRQPLHIFEPRYRQLMDHLMASPSRIMALAVLRPGWKPFYESKTCPIYPIVALGHVTNVERLDDGRYNFLWNGIQRAEVLEERNDTNQYRTAHLELLEDITTSASHQLDASVQAITRQIVEQFRDHRPELANHQLFNQLLSTSMPLSTLCDLIGFMLKVDQELTYPLLAELDVHARAEKLAHLLEHLSGSNDHGFPPEFSTN